MKSILIFALTMIVSLFSFSQKDIISVTYSKSTFYEMSGKKPYKDVMFNGEIVPDTSLMDIYEAGVPKMVRKDFDLSKMEFRMYFDGVLMLTLNIKSHSVDKNGVHKFTHDEVDIRTGDNLVTSHYLDTKNKTLSYTWYWDLSDNKTIVSFAKINNKVK